MGATPGTVEVEVQNGGVVPSELLPTLFEPMSGAHFRGKNSGGLGLGLYISQQIIRTQGHHRGALERIRGDVDLPGVAAACPAMGRAMKGVLIVDDEEDLRESLREFLEHEGCAVSTAADGAEALQYMVDGLPGLVILDLLMPVMSGNELYARMQNDERLCGVPVVISHLRSVAGPYRGAGHEEAHQLESTARDHQTAL